MIKNIKLSNNEIFWEYPRIIISSSPVLIRSDKGVHPVRINELIIIVDEDVSLQKVDSPVILRVLLDLPYSSLVLKSNNKFNEIFCSSDILHSN